MNEKYYISNDINFVQGRGDLMFAPSSAKHMSRNEAEDFIKKHPGYEMVVDKRANKSRMYIVSTPQRFIGKNGDIVTSLSSALSFDSVCEAYAYIDKNKELYFSIGPVFVINEKYKRYKRSDAKAEPKLICLHKRKPFSKATRERIFNNSNGICQICGRPILRDDFTIDHIVPLDRGGTNAISNLRPVHKKCNLIKGHYLDDEFIDGISDIACNYVYHSPTSDMTLKMLRGFIRGYISQNGGAL